VTAGFRSKPAIRYALFQIPDLILLSLGLAALVRWWDLPVFAAYALLAVWIAKDVILYPVLRVAYEADSPTGASAIHGALGVATQPLAPSGYVRIGSELWRAELAAADAAAPEGASVRVVDSRGLTLIVEPVAPTGP